MISGKNSTLFGGQRVTQRAWSGSLVGLVNRVSNGLLIPVGRGGRDRVSILGPRTLIDRGSILGPWTLSDRVSIFSWYEAPRPGKQTRCQ